MIPSDTRFATARSTEGAPGTDKSASFRYLADDDNVAIILLSTGEEEILGKCGWKGSSGQPCLLGLTSIFKGVSGMRKALLAMMLVLGISFLCYGQEKKDAQPAGGPDVGQPAPDFAVPWATADAVHYNQNELWKLSDQKGSNVILAFYVADWSGG